MKVLAVDSSSVTASVAILDGEKVVADFYLNAGLTHSQTLAPMVDLAVKNSGFKLSDLDFFAVTSGPGSFTGLRIGVATVKGLAVGCGKKCVGISSLLAAAWNCKDFEGIVCACMDARRSEVYSALFRASGGKLERLTADRAISLQDLKKELKNFNFKVKLVGDGAKMCYNSLLEGEKDKFELSSEISRYVNAKMVALASLDGYCEEKLLQPEDLNLQYLRLSQAERMILSKNNLK